VPDTTKSPPAAAKDDYAWANYLIYMEAGAELPWPAIEPPKPFPLWPGVLLASALALAAYLVTSPAVGLLPAGLNEPVMFVLPLGILIGNLCKLPDRCKSGVRYTVKTVLTVGIVLLGARLNFGDVLKVGAPALAMSAAQVALLLGMALVLRRTMRLGGKQATLLGVGTAICGGSAVIATAPVIEADERDVAFSVATVSFLGLLAMFLLPVAAKLFGMDPRSFGVWAGLAIHQTPQAVAAGFAYHPEAGQAATLVKLARVCLLAPVVLILGFLYRHRVHARERRKYGFFDFLPAMVIGFLGLAVAHTLRLIPSLQFPQGSILPSTDLLDLFRVGSGFAITMGMAAVGLETSFGSLRNVGLRPIVAGGLLAIAAAFFSLAAIRLFGA
jgi:uncharacterized integral membrane protein (TIGR00698 family)